MSVNLMSAIFETTFFDLQDEKGNVLKASTAKLVLLAMADHANDEGEGVYPSLQRLCKKTALSEQTIRNAFDALRYNGILSLEGKSKHGTNNHTINTKSFPKAIGKEPVYLTLQPLGGLTDNAGGSNGYLNTPHPLDPNHHITIIESYSDEVSKNTAYRRGEQEAPDKLDAILEMANFPGAKIQARIDSILSYLGGALQRNTETKDWKEFAKYVDSEKQTKGWDVKVFVAWMKGQKGYDPAYWSCKRMREFYPMAFVVSDTTALTVDENGVPETY